MTSVQPKRMRGRWWKVALGLLLLGVVVPAITLPAWLNSGAGRRWLLGRANRVLAPGRLDVASFHFSWFGSTRMSGLVLTDHQGVRAIASPRVRWERSLGQILWAAPRYGTLVLQGAALDVERDADGTINILDTLKPILRADPELDLHIVLDRGRLRLRSAGLSEPILADLPDARLDLAAAPAPLTWRLNLAQGDASDRAGTFLIEGTYDRWNKAQDGTSNLAMSATAKGWACALAQQGLTVRGRLDGTVSVDRRDGRWASAANASIAALDVSGSRLGGDRLRWDRVAAVWDISETAGAWSVRRLDLTAPVGSLHASGTGTDTSRIDGKLDIAALAQQMPHALGLRDDVALEKGSAVLAISGHREAADYRWDVEARLTDLHARDRQRQREIALKSPATLTARVTAKAGSLALDRIALASEFLNVEGSGTLDDGVTLTGKLDLAGAQRQLDDVIDFGAMRLAGVGNLSGHYRRQGDAYEARLAADVRALHVEGLGFAAIDRDSAALRVELKGPAAGSGIPAALGSGNGTLTSGRLMAEVAARQDAEAMIWDAAARIPASLGGRDVEALAKVSARAQGAAVALPSVELRVEPKGGEPVVLRARGSLDRSKGLIVLTPPQGAPEADAIYLTADGLTVQGLGTSRSLHAEAAFGGDLARLSQLLAPDAGSLRGTWSGRLRADARESGVQINARLEARDVAQDIEGPIALSLDALAIPDTDRVDVRALAVSSRYATIQAAGRLNLGKDERKLVLNGSIAPGWEAINRLAAQRIDPGARVAGKPGKLALEIALQDLSVQAVRQSLRGEAGFELTSADFFGMRVGQTPVAIRAGDGKLWLAPIETTINEGRLHLEPRLDLDDAQGPLLVLGPESGLRDAAINDEVSHRVLSFVAPVLESATRVRGRVSVALEDAEFPIGGSPDRHASVDGTVTFQDVEFVAGPLVDDLFAVIGREPKASLKLNKPVSLLIADGHVETKGLALPLGNVTEIALDGWVDFDRRMNMVASLPVTRKMVLGVDFLGDIVEGTKIGVPIRGTIDHPEIDKDALKLGMKDLGKTLLERTAGRSAAELLMRLTRPPDRNAPPRLTPAERRARRMERRMERNQGVPPGNP